MCYITYAYLYLFVTSMWLLCSYDVTKFLEPTRTYNLKHRCVCRLGTLVWRLCGLHTIFEVRMNIVQGSANRNIRQKLFSCFLMRRTNLTELWPPGCDSDSKQLRWPVSLSMFKYSMKQVSKTHAVPDILWFVSNQGYEQGPHSPDVIYLNRSTSKVWHLYLNTESLWLNLSLAAFRKKTNPILDAKYILVKINQAEWRSCFSSYLNKTFCWGALQLCKLYLTKLKGVCLRASLTTKSFLIMA